MSRERIVIKRGDITEETTDAIVNAANTELMLGAGVAGAIRRKGGPTIQAQCTAHGGVPLGEAAITAAGDLKAKHVIHAASMGLGGPLTTERSLRDSVRNSLLRSTEHGLKSIAFPAIGTGIVYQPVFGGPGDGSTAMSAQVVTQIIAVAVAIAWAAAGTAIAATIVKLVMGLRVTPEVESDGLDIGEHGERAYN